MRLQYRRAYKRGLKARAQDAVCCLLFGLPSYAPTAAGSANCVSIFAEALKKSCSDWLNR